MQHMSKEKSNDWLEEPFDEVYEREFEEAFDLAFENAAAASTSVNKEAMAASWDKVNHEIQNIKKRKKRIKRWQLAGVIAASITIGATIFSSPIGTQANTFVQRLQQVGDNLVLVFQGPRQDFSGAKTPPPPGMIENPSYNFSGDPEELYSQFENQVSVQHNLFLVEVPKEKAFSNTTFHINNFDLPLTPTHIKYHLLLDQENPVYPENPYLSNEIYIEYFDGDERIAKVSVKKMFSVNPGAPESGPAFSGVPEEVALDDGTVAVFYENMEHDQLAYRSNLVMVMLMGSESISKEELLQFANIIQETNQFPMKE